MKRIDAYITKKQYEDIKNISKELGISFAELLRRLLDKAMENKATL